MNKSDKQENISDVEKLLNNETKPGIQFLQK